jgi:hypothetical protein
MAEPLSAFDAARVRWGWGTSSDPAERERFAQAGLSPLTSEERMRMERGWGASPLASKESREAMVAEEVRRGDRPASQLPEAYGGRPTGTTRRAFRMQQAWDEQQAAAVQQQQEMRAQAEYQRQLERAARQEAREEYRYNKEVEADLANSTKDLEIEKQGMAFASGLRQLDPRSPDYLIERTKLYDDNPLALADPNIQKLTNEYDEINKIYRERDEKKAQETEATSGQRDQQLMQLTKLAKLTGRNLSDLAQSDIQTQELIVDPIAVGEAEAELARRPERQAADPASSVLRQEAKELRSSIREKDMGIVTATKELEAAGTNEKKREVAQQKLEELTIQRNMLATDLLGIDSYLSQTGQTEPTPAAERPERERPSETQIATAQKAANDPNQSESIRRAAQRFLENNNIPIETQTAPTQAPATRGGTTETAPTAQVTRPQTRPEPTLETVASESMIRDMTDEETLGSELDRLYKLGYKFSPNKQQRELYSRISSQLKETRSSKNKEKFKRAGEIRKRMNEIGAFNSNPSLREEYIRLQQEREVLLGA